MTGCRSPSPPSRRAALPFVGQTLVEFALILPLLMLVLLAIAEMGFLLIWQHESQRTAEVLADVAAVRASIDGDGWRASWEPIAADEEARSGCSGAVITFPDGTHNPGDRVRSELTCHFTPKVSRLWGGLDVTLVGEAVVPMGAGSPVP